MRSAKRRLLSMLLAPMVLVLLAAPTRAGVQPSYTVTDLGTVGGDSSTTLGLSPSGLVVGDFTLGTAEAMSAGETSATPTGGGAAPITHAFLWEDGVMTDLGTLGGLSSTTASVNDGGQVIIWSTAEDGRQRGYVWDDGNATDIGTLGGAHTAPVRINAAGQVVGMSTTEPGLEIGDAGTHAFVWEDGVMTDLGTLGGEFSRANAINDRGQVAGGAETADGAIHAFLWEDGKMTDLGTTPGYADSRVISIAPNGLMAGFAAAPSDELVADGAPELIGLVFTGEEIVPIDPLPGYEVAAVGFGINSAGQVVGRSDGPEVPGEDVPPSHAFLWRDGVSVDLNNLIDAGSGWELNGAWGINDAGQIAGEGSIDGERHAVLLTPAA